MAKKKKLTARSEHKKRFSSKYKDNYWIDEINNWYNKWCGPAKLNTQLKGNMIKVGAKPKICPRCKIKYVGSGSEQYVLQENFKNVPCVPKHCYYCKKKIKIEEKEHEKKSFESLSESLGSSTQSE